MSWRSAIAWVLLFAVLVLAGTRLLDADDDGATPAAGAEVKATVTRVVDGDTVRVRLAGGGEQTVRYIGVDTPESVKPDTPVQCFGKAASKFNERLVENKRVRLRVGRERTDRYGRLLAYVYLDGAPRTFVNSELIRRGYARTLAISPNIDFASRLARLQQRAQRLRAGLWGACVR